MKKIIVSVVITIVFMITASCRKSQTDSLDLVLNFAQEFGEMASKGDIAGIKEVYDYDGEISSVSLDYKKNKIQIFTEKNGVYKIIYGNGAYITVREGHNGAFEVLSTEGIISTPYKSSDKSIESEDKTLSDNTSVTTEPIDVSDDTVKDFAKKFKANVKADKNWSDGGWIDSENYGNAYIYVNNNNDVAIDASDYYITYKYEYLYDMGADMYSENCKQKGKSLPAHGKVKFTNHYTDDCGPLEVKVNFNLTDRQLYDKYAHK